jgi:hypothetical protein
MRTITAHKPTTTSATAEFFSVNSWLMFLLAVVAGCLNIYLVQELVLTEEVYHNTLGERMAYDRIEKMLTQQQEWSWLGYVFIPLGVFLQTLAISLCLITGVVFSYTKVSFKSLFGMVLKVVAIIMVIRLLPTLVLIFQDVQVIDDLLKTDWYSSLALFGRDNVPVWAQIPLSAVNLFHMMLLVGLIAGLNYLTDKNTSNLALISYGCGTLLWWIALMYVQVSLG